MKNSEQCINRGHKKNFYKIFHTGLIASLEEAFVKRQKKQGPAANDASSCIFLAYPLIEMRGGNLSTAIANFGGRYARELF